jgi:hypothetical protein
MTELEAAQAIAKGDLPSPYPLGGMTLFAVRVTGTGMSYRDSLDEYVWRDPSLYLNDEFLARVPGLPLVWIHPETGSLNSEEFANRVIGTLMFGYVQDEDVWGIARVYDEEAIRRMTDGQLSTSPGVVFKPGDGNVSKEHEGKKLLIEGKPSILDHLAVCEQGVWDKGGDPVGVLNETLTQESGVAEEEKKEDSARHDAEAKFDAKFDAIMDAIKCMDAARKDEFERMDARMDAFEKRKDQSEESMADAKRKDAKEEDCDSKKDSEEEEKKDSEDKEEKKDSKKDAARKDEEEASEDKKKEKEEEKAQKEEEKTDAMRKDSAAARNDAELRAQIAELTKVVRTLTVETPPEERDVLAATQARADAVAAQFGEQASAPIPGESALAYRKRQLNRFKKHSPRFKDEKFDFLTGAPLAATEDIIYADAMAAARSTSDSSTIGRLIPLQKRDSAGRLITEFAGDPLAWMQSFMSGGQRGSIFNPNQRRI